MRSSTSEGEKANHRTESVDKAPKIGYEEEIVEQMVQVPKVELLAVLEKFAQCHMEQIIQAPKIVHGEGIVGQIVQVSKVEVVEEIAQVAKA